jgi:ABC-type nitrate/sulfonate/bicarbonate transport system substrate-binding protein
MSRNTFRKLNIMIVLVAMLATLFLGPSSAFATDPITLNVPLGWLNNDEFAGPQVAQDKGFFAEEGLVVNLISGGGSTGFDPIIAINGFDDGIRIGIPAALSLMVKAKGADATKDIIAVAALTQYEPGGFITLVENGRRAQGPCDFKDRVVAMQTEAAWYMDALGARCETGALKPGVDFTVIPAGWSPDCLLTGGCDFYCGWATNQVFALAQEGYLPYPTDDQSVEGQKYYEFFLGSQYLPFLYADVVATTKDFATRHPEIVGAFVRATVKGMQYTLDHPEEAIAIASAVPGVDPAHAAWRIPIQNTLMENADTDKYGLGYMDPTKVQAMIDFLTENGQIPASYDAATLIDNSFLPGPTK